MGEKKKNSNVFPLSPDPCLSEDDVCIYCNFLQDVLEGSEVYRIHNIAITSGFGTGKSSLVRSYDKLKYINEHPIKAKFEIILTLAKRIPRDIRSYTFRKKVEKDHAKKINISSLIDFIKKVPKNIKNFVKLSNNDKISAIKKMSSDIQKNYRNIKTNIIRWRTITRKKADKVLISRFLYVSVGEYASTNEKERKRQSDEILGTNQLKKEEELTSIKAIERRMLLQIFARFRRTDLPQTSFRLVPEAWTKRLWMIAVLFGCFVFSALLLIFHKQLGQLLVSVNNMEGGLIMGFLVKYKTLFRLLLSAYCIGFGAIASVFLCIRIFPRIRFHELSVKGANAELSLEREAAESYLDLYSMELVYCLEKIAVKIDHVVVFEDMDRLNSGDCLYILTRLREINNLVNLRLQKKGQPLRFIYAVNDDFLGTVQHEKFFDFILPVIPEMNRRSAAVLFVNKIKKIDENYGKEVSRVFPQFETVASYLSDYRLQNTILNEYQVLLKLYTSKNKIEMPETSQKNEILAFAIYKNCWPEDYNALRENNSRIFTNEGVRCPNRLKHAQYGKLLEVLTDYHLLTIHSLYYANFDETTLANMYYKHWEAAVNNPEEHKVVISELDAIQDGEEECLKKVKEFFDGLEHLVVTDGTESSYHVELFRAVVCCMVRCKQKDNDWFFNEKNNLKDCLHLLAEMKCDPDETFKTKFFQLSSESQKINSLNFFPQFGKTDTLEISKLELRELCRGIKSFPTDNIRVTDSPENPNKIVDQFRNRFKQDGSTLYFE